MYLHQANWMEVPFISNYDENEKMTLFLPIPLWKTSYQFCDYLVKATSKWDTVFSCPFVHTINTITITPT